MLEIKNLTIRIKSQDKDKTQGDNILDNVNISMEPGKAYVLSGRNGSGKSSLLSAIMGHPSYEIVGGEMLVDNKVISNNDVAASASAGIYMTMQIVPEIEGVTLIQLLHKAINKRSSGKGDMSILDLNKQLIKYCEEFDIDKGYINRDLNYKMSGGEKKQSELLHILALAPRYILVDEIDSGVDRESIDKIFKVLKYLQEEHNSALLIVSHHTNVNEYLNIEKVYTLDNQTII